MISYLKARFQLRTTHAIQDLEVGEAHLDKKDVTDLSSHSSAPSEVSQEVCNEFRKLLDRIELILLTLQ